MPVMNGATAPTNHLNYNDAYEFVDDGVLINGGDDDPSRRSNKRRTSSRTSATLNNNYRTNEVRYN